MFDWFLNTPLNVKVGISNWDSEDESVINLLSKTMSFNILQLQSQTKKLEKSKEIQ